MTRPDMPPVYWMGPDYWLPTVYVTCAHDAQHFPNKLSAERALRRAYGSVAAAQRAHNRIVGMEAVNACSQEPRCLGPTVIG